MNLLKKIFSRKEKSSTINVEEKNPDWNSIRDNKVVDLDFMEKPLVAWSRQKDISKEYINEVEKRLSIKLPNEYVQFILSANGMFPLKRSVFYSYEKDLYMGIQGFNSLKHHENPVENESWWYERHKSTFPFAYDDFGGEFYFDFSGNNNGEVFHFSHMETTYICDSFKSFINGLISEEELENLEEE